MKKTTTKPLNARQRADLKAVAAIPDAKIDTTEAPEQVDWRGAQRGMFYRPIKKQITLRIDADLIDWFRRHTTPETGYQTLINSALRDYRARHGKR
jgi:uncharacterized protein (DUF4415 family)